MQNSKKITSLALLAFLIAACLAPYAVQNVSCTSAILAQNAFTEASGYVIGGFSSNAGGYNQSGQSFQVTSNGYITSLSIGIETFNSPVGTLICSITPMSGGYPDSNNIIETSIGGLSIFGLTNYDYIPVTFEFGGQHLYSTGTTYAFIVYSLDYTTLDNTNFLGIVGSTAAYGSGAPYRCSTTTGWTNNYYNNDAMFLLYGSDTPTPTASPTPAPATPTPAPDNLSIIITSLVTTNNVLLIIAFALIIIGAILGAKFAGGWGFLAGLTVGVGLDFMFGLISLWFVVLIGIVDAIALVRGINAARQDNGAA